VFRSITISAVRNPIARSLLAAAVSLAAAGCGLDTSADFNADGSVTIGLRFMIPKSAAEPGSGIKITGLSPADLASSQAKLEKLYPGAKVTRVTEGDETGALATIPFKTEKDAFAFLTQPSKLSAPSATSGSGMGLNLSDTGGLFKTATHTTSGGSDTYTFTTQPPPTPSPTPGAQTIPGGDALLSIFVITFSLTVPHVITSAPGALFTLDRKTAIWKLSLTSPQTLEATTGTDTGLVASVTPAPDPRLLVAVGFIAVAVGFLLGGFLPWRGLISRPTVRVAAPPAAPATHTDPVAWPGPPSDAPPPTKL
jgi:hypothetical protein